MKRHRHIQRTLAGVLIVLAVGLGLGGLSSRARAQTELTTNPIDLINGTVNFEVQAPILPLLAFHAGLDFITWDGVWDDSPGDVFAVGPEIGLRFFPFLGAPSGLWIGPYAGIAYVAVDDGTDRATGAGLFTGAMAGFTALFWDTLVVSVGAGLDYRDLSQVIDDRDVGPRGLSPRFRLALGFAF